MDIAYETLPNGGGQIVAAQDGEQIGYLRWRIEDGVVYYGPLFVADGHRNQGISKALMLASKEHREANGNLPWRALPTTAAGTAAVNGHVARNYETDPRPEANNG